MSSLFLISAQFIIVLALSLSSNILFVSQKLKFIFTVSPLITNKGYFHHIFIYVEMFYFFVSCL